MLLFLGHGVLRGFVLFTTHQFAFGSDGVRSDGQLHLHGLEHLEAHLLHLWIECLKFFRGLKAFKIKGPLTLESSGGAGLGGLGLWCLGGLWCRCRFSRFLLGGGRRLFYWGWRCCWLLGFLFGTGR